MSALASTRGVAIRPHATLSTAMRLHISPAMVGLGSVYLALATILMYVVGYHEPDALSRTASAYISVLGRDPKLEALGFVWTPLPGWLQIPLVVLLQPFGLQPMAGPIVSVAATLLTLLLMSHAYRVWGLPTWLRHGALALYALNPMIVMYAVNGQSEALLILCVAAAVFWFSRWSETGQIHCLALVGVALSAGFLARYEAVPVMLACTLGLLSVSIGHRSYPRAKLFSLILVLTLPPLYTIAVWMLFNWVIMGDATYFLTGPYSNTAQTAIFRDPDSYFGGLYHSVAEATAYVLERAGHLSPAALVLAMVATGLGIARRSWPALAIIGIWCSLPFFGAYLLYAGASYGFLRFYIYVIPAGLFMAREVWQLSPRHLRAPSGMLALTLLALALPTSLNALQDSRLGRMEYAIFNHVQGQPYEQRLFSGFETEKHVATLLDERAERTRVLLDIVTGFPVVAYSRHPDQFVTTTDLDFREIVNRPSIGVTHILFRDPRDPNDSLALGAYEVLVRQYPELLDNAASWATLEWRHGNWLLYRVLGDPPERG